MRGEGGGREGGGEGGKMNGFVVLSGEGGGGRVAMADLHSGAIARDKVA